MQLTRLVRRSGKAVWLLVLVPVLAVGASVAVLADAEPPVHTLATVSVVAPEGSSTAATVTQAVDGFKSTVTSATVRGLAADDTGVPVGEDRITAERIGTSNLVELRLRTDAGEDGAATLAALVDRANDALYSSAIASSEARIVQAERRYDDAIAERAKESARTGLLLPVEAYRAKASEVTQLRVALATGGAEVDLDEIRSSLTEAVKELRGIGESVTAFESLEDSVVRARTELGDAHEEADAVTTRRAAATAPESVTITDPVVESARTTLARGVVTALVLGVALGLGLVLLVGLLRPPSERPGPPPGTGDASRAHARVLPDDDRRGTRDYEAALT